MNVDIFFNTGDEVSAVFPRLGRSAKAHFRSKYSAAKLGDAMDVESATPFILVSTEEVVDLQLQQDDGVVIGSKNWLINEIQVSEDFTKILLREA